MINITSRDIQHMIIIQFENFSMSLHTFDFPSEKLKRIELIDTKKKKNNKIPQTDVKNNIIKSL